MRRKDYVTKARTPLRRLAIALLLVSILLLGIMTAAAATADRFYVSRLIAWREADFRDFERFPSRPVPAGSKEFSFKPAPENPPEYLRTVTYQRDAPDPASLRESMATTLDSVGGTEVTEPLERFLEDTDTTAFLVVRDDALLYEGYFNGHDRRSTQTSFSVAKSFVSALVGIAIQEGHIGSVDDPITEYIPELEGQGMDKVTIRHLLTMSSGLKYSGEGGGGGPFGDDAKTYYDPNLRELALTVEPEVEPGTRWEYNNYHPLLLGMVLERATDRPVATYLSQKVWRPLGMEADGSWSLDSEASGFEKMESGINGRAIDFAKFGRLYLNRGKWSGEQVVPEAWVEQSTRVDAASDPADFYQYFWWMDVVVPERGRFLARGNLGQFIYVAPDKDLVIVRMGEGFGYDRWPEVLRSIADKAPS
ncbi:MAG: beta-lactamase family protein [Actinomycetota bacterium]|nr:beta-lactamase family protein [Actinomycetota bacterium]